MGSTKVDVVIPGYNGSLPAYSHLSHDSSTLSSGIVRSTVTRVTREAGGFSLLTILMIVVAAVIVFIIVIGIVLYILKRNKLDKIRHHLMPLYNFDPADEEPHWETDLMEDDREQQIALNTGPGPTGGRAKLKFHTQGDVDM